MAPESLFTPFNHGRRQKHFDGFTGFANATKGYGNIAFGNITIPLVQNRLILMYVSMYIMFKQCTTFLQKQFFFICFRNVILVQSDKAIDYIKV